jgi:hypothetical protein
MGARRAGIATVAVLGATLFGSAVHGLTQVDGSLAEADRQQDELRQERRAVDDRRCPERKLRLRQEI